MGNSTRLPLFFCEILFAGGTPYCSHGSLMVGAVECWGLKLGQLYTRLTACTITANPGVGVLFLPVLPLTNLMWGEFGRAPASDVCFKCCFLCELLDSPRHICHFMFWYDFSQIHFLRDGVLSKL